MDLSGVKKTDIGVAAISTWRQLFSSLFRLPSILLGCYAGAQYFRSH